jgi:hypothetical protein
VSQRSERIYSLSLCEGFPELIEMLKEQISEPKDRLYSIMSSKPDTLTGKSAIKLAATAKALERFKESLEDEIRISNPSTRIGQGS